MFRLDFSSVSLVTFEGLPGFPGLPGWMTRVKKYFLIKLAAPESNSYPLETYNLYHGEVKFCPSWMVILSVYCEKLMVKIAHENENR